MFINYSCIAIYILMLNRSMTLTLNLILFNGNNLTLEFPLVLHVCCVTSKINNKLVSLVKLTFLSLSVQDMVLEINIDKTI